MNLRERFLLTVHFQKPDSIPNFEIGFWDETIERWHREGLPSYVCQVSSGSCLPINAQRRVPGLGSSCMDGCSSGVVGITQYFGMDVHARTPIPVNTRGPIPPLGPKIIKDEGETVVELNELGVMLRRRKKFSTIPQFIRFPVKTLKDFEEIKFRFNPKSPERYPKDWNRLVKTYRGRDYPLAIVFNGFFWQLRALMGLRNLCIAFYRDPELVREIVDFWAEFNIQVARRAVEEVEVDCAYFFEDMAYRKSSMISPEMFRRFILPCYKRCTDFLREHGIDTIFVDSDGNLNDLIPLFLEGGVNGVFPVEVMAGNDPIALRRKYGKRLVIFGGIDKYALVHGPEAISRELERKLPYLLSEGGYIPAVDHLISPDVSLKNFKYYVQLKMRMLRDYN